MNQLFPRPVHKTGAVRLQDRVLVEVVVGVRRVQDVLQGEGGAECVDGKTGIVESVVGGFARLLLVDQVSRHDVLDGGEDAAAGQAAEVGHGRVGAVAAVSGLLFLSKINFCIVAKFWFIGDVCNLRFPFFFHYTQFL